MYIRRDLSRSFLFLSSTLQGTDWEEESTRDLNFVEQNINLCYSTQSPAFQLTNKNTRTGTSPKPNLYANKMSGFNFFSRSSRASSTASSPSQKTSLELFADYVGDGESHISYDFPPLDVLEFDAKPFDSFERLDKPTEVATAATYDLPPANHNTPSPYEFNIDLEAELRAEIALFSQAIKADDKFKETLFDWPATSRWRFKESDG